VSAPTDKERLGLDAQTVLNSEAFKLAIESVRNTAMQTWLSGAAPTPEARETVYRHVQAVNAIEVELHRILNDLKVSVANAKARERREASTPEKLRILRPE
jgi:hypothetical protein